MPLLLNAQTEPSVPVANKGLLYEDSSDRAPTFKDEKAVINKMLRNAMPNTLRNSGMWFGQRQGPATLTNVGSTTLRAAGVLAGADGWGIWNENANTSYQRTDTIGAVESGLSGRFYGTFLKTTSTGKFFISQMLEGNETGTIRTRTVRWQAWMKATSALTFRLGLVQLTSAGTVDTLPATFISAAGANGADPTLGTNLSYIAPKSRSGLVGDNCTINGNAFDCSVTTSWQRFGGLFDVPSNCKNILACIWTNAQAAAAAGLSIAQLSLTDGEEIQAWTPLSYQLEVERVQRIYCKTFPVDTLPAQTGGVGNALRGGVAIAGAVATSSVMQWLFPVKMRAAPTLTFFNPSAGNAFLRNIARSTDSTATASANVTENYSDINATGLAAWTAGDEIKVCAVADAAGTNNEFA